MIVSLGRSLRWFGQRRDPAPHLTAPPRPYGDLIWLHVPDPLWAAGMIELARRLIEEDAVPVLLTSTQPLNAALPKGVLHGPAPEDTSTAVKGFLDHWKPAIVVFSEGELRPTLIQACSLRHIPLLMTEGQRPRILPGFESWLPGQMRHSLGHFTHIWTLDEGAARAFRKAGAPQVQAAGRMEEPSAALPTIEAEREALAAALTARPIWFASSVPRSEETAVLQAHLNAQNLAHRLLLILMTETPQREEELARQLTIEGWNVASRSLEQEADSETEIWLVSDPAELGLWYRLAPITFLGGSLLALGAQRSPMEPAALGSAIIHGPKPGIHSAALARLGAARGARSVSTARDLSEALADLLSPERTARLAQAAWGVASDGAEVTEAVMDRIRAILDAGPGGGSHARP